MYEETVEGLNIWHVYVGDRCREDYGDVRFTDGSGNELTYYLWPDCGEDEARFCVRLEGADGFGTLMIHHGNASAESVSDGHATYLFYEDFEGLTHCGSGGSIATGMSAGGDKSYHKTDRQTATFTLPDVISQDVIIEHYTYLTHRGFSDRRWFSYLNSESEAVARDSQRFSGDYVDGRGTLFNAARNTSQSIPVNTWCRIRTTLKFSIGKGDLSAYLPDGSRVYSFSDINLYAVDSNIKYLQNVAYPDSNTSSPIYYDNFTIRAHSSTPPHLAPHFSLILDDTLSLDDALLLDGAQQLLCTDHLPLSDEIEERTLKDHLILEDTLPLTEEFPSTAYLSDRLHLSDEFRTKHIPPGGVFSISGTQWMPGSELPCAGATIHLIKRYSNLVLVDLVDLFDELELVHSRDGSTLSSEVIDGGTEPGDPPEPAREIIPPGNAPEYLTTTDDYGFFHMEDIPEGKYVLVAMKPGYSVDIQQVDLAEDVYVASMMYPVSTWGLIERPYDERGNILKMYLYGDVVDGEDRIVDGIVVFGDLYGTAIEPSGATPIVPGHLSVIDRFVIGTIDIVDTPILGRIGFFEAATETLDVNPDHTIITWNAAGPKGDFDGFCFRYRFHHLMTGVLTLSLFSRVVVPETTSSGSPSSPSSPSSPGSPGTTGNQPNWGGNWNTYTPTTHVPWKPKWSPYFGVGLSDGLRVHSPASTRQTGVVKRIAFSETVGVSAVSVTPPRLSMTGVAVSDAGKAVSGATVVIKARRTGRVVAETTTAENGLWRVTGLESELIYDVLIFEPESPTVYSSGGSIQVLDRDIVDNRALMLVEDIVYRDDGSNQYIDFRIILPPHGTRLDADGRAYGEVINKFTREPVIGALVEVYPGTLDVDDLETYSGQIFAYRTHEREYVTDGFYEVYLPGGSYTLRVTASGYADSELYHFTIQAGGWERDIELVRGTVIGHVYDALDHSAGIQTPIEGAVVSVGDTDVVTGDDGSYTIMSAVDSRTGEATCIVACSNVDYVTAEKRVRVTGMDATRLNFYLWRVQQYHHQTT